MKIKSRALALWVLFHFIFALVGIQAQEAIGNEALIDQYYASMQRYEELLESKGPASAETQKAYNEFQQLNAQINGTEFEKLPDSSLLDSVREGADNYQKDVKTSLKSRFDNFIKTKLTKDYAKEFFIGTPGNMSKIESLGWTIGKAILPTIAVIGFTALCPLPAVGLVIGAVVVGASSGALMSMIFDGRANMFKAEGAKKETSKIIRDAVVSGVREGVMAPFTVATGGLVKVSSSLASGMLVKTALHSATVSFAGGVVSSGVSGLTKRVFNNKVYNYDEILKKNEIEIDNILNSHSGANASPLTPAEEQRLEELVQENDRIRLDHYGLSNFKDDVKKSAVSSIVTGFFGNMAFTGAANSEIAKKASVHVVGNTSLAGQISKTVVSVPFDFSVGVVNGLLDKSTYAEKIAECRKKMQGLNPNDAKYQYYKSQEQKYTSQLESIDIIKRGKDQALVSAAVNSSSLAFSVAKNKLWDARRAKADAVNEEYRKENAEWKEAMKVKQKIDERMKGKPELPNPKDYFSTKEGFLKKCNIESLDDGKIKLVDPKGVEHIFRTQSQIDSFAGTQAGLNLSNYKSDLMSYQSEIRKYYSEISSLQKDYKALEIKAKTSDLIAENRKLKSEVSAKYDLQMQKNKRLELAKIDGENAYAMQLAKEQIREGKGIVASDGKYTYEKNGQKTVFSNEKELQNHLQQENINQIRSEYHAKSVKATENFSTTKEKIAEAELASKGIAETRDDGKYWVVRDSEGKTIREYKFTENDIKRNSKRPAEVIQIESDGLRVNPSEYKVAYAEMKVAELRAQGYDQKYINSVAEQIAKEADKAMFDKFGNIFTVMGREVMATQLDKGKYGKNSVEEIKKLLASRINADAVTSMYRKDLENELRTEFQGITNDIVFKYIRSDNSNSENKTDGELFVDKFTGNIVDKTKQEVDNGLFNTMTGR